MPPTATIVVTQREGFYFTRESLESLLSSLYIARGSAGEVRSMFGFFERRPALRDFKSQISNLKSIAESCSRQIRAWADSLQNSDIKGQRHLTEKSRRQSDAQKRAVETWQRINDSLPDGHPAKKPKI